MEKNKTGKYLKYAFGEILLVVIGILIALSINTWNEGRKSDIKEHQIFGQLKDDYDSNLLQLEQKITHRKKIIKAANKVLRLIDEPLNTNSDILYSQLYIMMGTPTFKPIQNNLINSGNILLIKNEKLNQLLTTWPSDVLAIQEIERIWDTRMWESLIPLLIDFGILRDGLHKWWNDQQNLKWIMDGTSINPFQEPKSSKALETNEILKKQELEGIISIAVSVNYAANLQSQVLHKRILEILELLNNEIGEN